MIIPAILEKDFEEVKRKIELVYDVAKKIQIDVIDNTVVQGNSFKDIYKLNEIDTQAELDIHLMVKNPIGYLKSGIIFASMKDKIRCVNTITTQLILDKFTSTLAMDFNKLLEDISKKEPDSSNHTADPNLYGTNPKEKIINEINMNIGKFMQDNNQKIQKFIDEAKGIGYKIGLSTDPMHDVFLLEPFLNYIDIVQFMGVVPGKQGGELIPSVLDKITKFKSTFPGITTQIDGGVNEYNFHDILKTGVDNIVVGSAIFNSDNPKQKFMEFSNLFNERNTAHGRDSYN